MGITDILNIAKSSLAANQQAMQVLGHNIANAGTKGYSVQRINFSSKIPLVTANGLFGRGVDAGSVVRAEARFLKERLRFETQGLGKWTSINKSLMEIELSFSGPGESDLSASITNFFNANEELSLNPESLAARANLIQRAEFMTTKFNTTAELLLRMQINIDREIQTVARQVNEFTDKIASINELIIVAEAGGNVANDLRDRRDLLLEEVSELLDVNILRKKDGGFIVSLDGNLLVDGKAQRDLVIVQKSSGRGSITTLSLKGNTTKLKVKGGQLGGLIDTRDNYIGEYRLSLDKMAVNLSKSINAIHSTGFDLDGNTGINFFKTKIESALDMTVNSEISSNSRRIAAAGGYDTDADSINDTSNGPGDNSIIKLMAGLRNSAIDTDGVESIFDSYGSLLGSIAFDAEQAKESVEIQELLVDQITNMKDAKIGVSLDEEIAKMIVFQNNYASTARIINVVDKMMQTMLEMLA